MTTLFVSFRGEDASTSDGGSHPAHAIRPIENIVAFPEGEPSFEILQPPNDPIELRELRGFLFSEGYLYVANGYKHQHQILRFKPGQPQGQWQYDTTVATDTLKHPFAVIPAFDNALFVSSQDDNQVTVYGSPYADGSVFVSGFTALRGLAYDGRYLYVADSGDNKQPGYVAFYDSHANEHGRLVVKQPVHLLYDSGHGWLFIGDEGSGSVEIYNPVQRTGPTGLIAKGDASINHTSGLALETSAGATGTLYVASRVGRQVFSFPLDFSSGTPRLNGTPTVALDRLDDEPEFVGLEGGIFG